MAKDLSEQRLRLVIGIAIRQQTSVGIDSKVPVKCRAGAHHDIHPGFHCGARDLTIPRGYGDQRHFGFPHLGKQSP